MSNTAYASWKDGRCTRCGAQAEVESIGFSCTMQPNVTYKNTRFCQNCGARMGENVLAAAEKHLIGLLESVPCEGVAKELGGCPDRKNDFCGLVDKLDYCSLVHMAKHLIAQGVVTTGWIPVTEAVPNFYPGKRRKVLVTMEDKEGNRFVSTAKYDGTSNCWYDFIDWRYLEFKVLAWMLKPEAYNPEEVQNGGRG